VHTTITIIMILLVGARCFVRFYPPIAVIVGDMNVKMTQFDMWRFFIPLDCHA